MASGEIARLSDVSPPAISQHLKILKAARLVRVHPRKQQRIYELDPEGMAELAQWFERIYALSRSETGRAGGGTLKKENEKG